MIINKGDDLIINLAIDGISKIRIFTSDRKTFVEAIPKNNVVKVNGDSLTKLKSGVIAYIYKLSTSDNSFDDGTYDLSNIVYTEYYLRDNDEDGLNTLTVSSSSLKNYVDAEIERMISKYVSLLNDFASKESLENEAATNLKRYTELKNYIDDENAKLSKSINEKLSTKVEELQFNQEISDRKKNEVQLKNYVDKVIENNIGKLA